MRPIIKNIIFIRVACMKNIYFKKNAVIFTILLSFFCVRDCFCPPWNANTREHLFGPVNNTSIQDEGFRWKDSFNFKINGTAYGLAAGDHASVFPANVEHWKFNKGIEWNDAHRMINVADNNWQNANPNQIHQHLGKIVDYIKNAAGGMSVSIAALTIIVDVRPEGSDNPIYRAYSKIIKNAGRTLIAVNGAENPDETLFSLVLNAGVSVFTPLQYINSNIPRTRADPNFQYLYNCTEGKILSQLLGTPLLREEIEALRLKSHNNQVEHHEGEANAVNANNIKLVVLHIGTSMDPCAICTRCFVGLSRDANYQPELADGHARYNLGDGINAKFLIEVSSNGHYTVSTGADNYQATNGKCSHTECAGHDSHHADLLNVALNDAFPMEMPAAEAGHLLSIPRGVGDGANWRFNDSFPPYVIFGRMVPTAYVVTNAPLYNHHSSGNVCGSTDAGAEQRHNAPGSLETGRHILKSNLPQVN